jgi:hypothetical protein
MSLLHKTPKPGHLDLSGSKKSITDHLSRLRARSITSSPGSASRSLQISSVSPLSLFKPQAPTFLSADVSRSSMRTRASAAFNSGGSDLACFSMSSKRVLSVELYQRVNCSRAGQGVHFDFARSSSGKELLLSLRIPSRNLQLSASGSLRNFIVRDVEI